MLVRTLLLFFVFSYLFRTDLSFDQDLGRHIKLGEIISKTYQVPKNNLFSYTNPDYPFINTHWLFGVLAYWFTQTVGLEVFLILKVVIFIFSVWLILKLVPKPGHFLLLPIGFIFLHVLRERLELRPEIFSFLFTASTYFILEKASKGRTKLLFLLPVIQLLWINTHIYFFVGLVLQFIFILNLLYQHRTHIIAFILANHLVQKPDSGVTRQKRVPQNDIRGNLKLLVILFFLSLGACLINPNGLNGALFPLNVTKNYGYTIVENQTIFLLESINFKNPNFLFVKIAWALIILSLILTIIRKRFEPKSILLPLFGLGLSLINVRGFPYLVFLSLPLVLGNLSSNFLSRLPKLINILNMLVGLIILYESYFYLSSQYYKSRDDSHQVGLRLVEQGKGALDFMLKNNLPQPIFNNFDIGSYIIYRAYPKYQVFVDGRPEAYPKQFFLDTYIPMQSDYNKFKIEEQKWGFKTIIFSHTDQTPWGKTFLQSVVKDQEWKLVYIDDFMIALTKDESPPKVDLSTLSPNQFKFENPVSYLRLGIFLHLTGNIDAANSFITFSR